MGSRGVHVRGLGPAKAALGSGDPVRVATPDFGAGAGPAVRRPAQRCAVGRRGRVGVVHLDGDCIPTAVAHPVRASTAPVPHPVVIVVGNGPPALLVSSVDPGFPGAERASGAPVLADGVAPVAPRARVGALHGSVPAGEHAPVLLLPDPVGTGGAELFADGR